MANEMKERFTEVANISTDVLGELGKLVSAYKAYTETLAAVQRQIEYTKEYKEKQTQRAVLWGTVDTLPEKQAAAIRMRYQQSRTLKQIGEELGCSVEMARTHERKALRELRKPSRAKKLKPFFPEADRQRIYSRAISGTGLTSFEHSWTSATERAALQEL